MDVPTTAMERTPSLRSVSSNSSLASSVSLTRRPRTARTRSRTVTGGQPDAASLRTPPPDAAFFAGPVHAEPLDVHTKSEDAPMPAGFVVPIRDARDSVLSNFTQQSGVSSSLYPPSTSTASGTESPPSPRSIVSPDGDLDVPIMDDLQEYDGDDVSYRLRLLVKNNYFLPPAHSKPSAEDFAPSSPALNKKTSAPAFFDLFRGKAKSKPSTPLASPSTELPAPALRTPSDTLNKPRSSSNPLRPPLPVASPHGRVVVVREKMADLAGAAKQAELDMKTRGGGRASQRGQQDTFDDVIDPTDAVDLPPPSAKYPFAVQASALHGLGVHDSVGAAILADRLPPPASSANVLDSADDWRTALLKAAVGHSLDNLHSTPTSPMSFQSASPTPPPTLQHYLGRPIVVSHGANLPVSRFVDQHTRSSRARGMSSPETELRPTSYVPMRAETPVTPLTPLSPPPRRAINPLYSLSQTDLSVPISSLPPLPPSPNPSVASGLRKAISSPGLHTLARSQLTPPPLPVDMSRIQSASSLSFETSREHSTESVYSDDGRRTSVSSSYYSQASPTASAFQDAISLRRPDHDQDEDEEGDEDGDVESIPIPIPILRHDTISPPPPRVSSSSPGPFIALAPPPRASSLRPRPAASIEIFEPPPTTPPYARPESPPTPPYGLGRPGTPPYGHGHALGRPSTSPYSHTPPYGHGHARPTPSALHIPGGHIAPSIRSAPAPHSHAEGEGGEAPSFFDSIQAQPNAMDDLDSDEEESEDDEEESEEGSEEGEEGEESGEGSESEEGEGIEGDLEGGPSGMPIPGSGPSTSRSRPSTSSSTNSHSRTPHPHPPPHPPRERERTRTITGARDSLMRLGNHSTPYVTGARPGAGVGVGVGVGVPFFGGAPDSRVGVPFFGGAPDSRSRAPVGHVHTPEPRPETRPFFSETLASGSHSNSSFEFYKRERERERERPRTADVVGVGGGRGGGGRGGGGMGGGRGGIGGIGVAGMGGIGGGIVGVGVVAAGPSGWRPGSTTPSPSPTPSTGRRPATADAAGRRGGGGSATVNTTNTATTNNNTASTAATASTATATATTTGAGVGGGGADVGVGAGGDVQAWQHKQRDQESLRRLDGLLIRHMEAEKGRLKQIAVNFQAGAGAGGGGGGGGGGSLSASPGSGARSRSRSPSSASASASAGARR